MLRKDKQFLGVFMFTKTLALTLGLLSSMSFASVSNIQVRQAFDGRAASCSTQDDYIRLMRSGAYRISQPIIEMVQDSRLSVSFEVISLECEKKSDSEFGWKVIAPTETLEYPFVVFRDGVSEEVTVQVERKDPEVHLTNDEQAGLATAPVLPSRGGGYAASLEFDLLEAMNLNQVNQMDAGEVVRVRLGVFQRSMVRHLSSDGTETDFRQNTSGMFFIFFDISKENDKFVVEIAQK